MAQRAAEEAQAAAAAMAMVRLLLQPGALAAAAAVRHGRQNNHRLLSGSSLGVHHVGMQAATELEYRVELLNKMVASCHDKCSAKPYKEGILSVGETSCVDRCAAKYWQVVAIVGQLIGNAK